MSSKGNQQQENPFEHPDKKTSTNPPVRVFLSYARGDDEPFVKRLYADLVKAGFIVWFDREKMPSRGLTFLQEIRDAIDSHDRLVLVVGPKALISDYVTAEWQHALKFGKAITPILRQGDILDLPAELRLLDARDFRNDTGYTSELSSLLRQLSEPVPPMGKLIGVPSLPPHFLEQPNRLRTLKEAVMADLVRPEVVTGTSCRVGMHGMGGIGKSVLASALAHDSETRRAFPDGIYWIRFGQKPEILGLQRSLANQLGDITHYDTIENARVGLGKLLSEQRVLLILDDVWDVEHAKAFDILGRHCRAVMTTRDHALITSLGGKEQQVQLLTEAESLALLADWSNTKVELLPTIAKDVASECGRLPLALSICGAMVRDGQPWADLLEALREQDLEFVEHPHGSILRSIKLSYETLSDKQQQRFAELVVFPADATVPESAIVTLWGKTGNLKPRHGRELIQRLYRRALVRIDTLPPEPGKEPIRRVSMHDLIYDFASTRAPERVNLHYNLVEAYTTLCPNGWATGPDDGWFFQQIPWHVKEASQIENGFELARDENFLTAQTRFVPNDPDLPLRTIRYAIDAACVPPKPIQMAEFTLKHANYLIEQRKKETPLDALLNPNLPPQVALERAWNLADLLEDQYRSYALLLLTWKLQQMQRMEDAATTLVRIDLEKAGKISDLVPQATFLLSHISPIINIDLITIVTTLFNSEGLAQLSKSYTGAKQFSAAFEAAKQIADNKGRSEALLEIAKAQIQAKQDPTKTFSTALDAAIKIQSELARIEVLLAIAEVQVQAGQDPTKILSEALDTARQTELDWLLSMALLAIAKAKAKVGQFSVALDTAGQIPIVRYLFQAFLEIATAQAQAGKDAVYTLSGVLDTAHKIQDKGKHSIALSAIAQAQAQAGQCSVALDTARQIAENVDCSEAFLGIAKTQIQIGQDPTNTLSMAFEAANQIEHKFSRSETLLAIAKVQIQIGIFSGALETANKIQEEGDRSDVLLSIAQAQEQAGQDPTNTLSMALETATQIQGKRKRSEIIFEIDKAQAGEDITNILLAPLKAAPQIQDEWYLSLSLLKIVKVRTLSEHDKINIISMALSAAMQIKDQFFRSPALSAIAESQVQAGLDPTNTLSAALDAAKQIQSEWDCVRALLEIAKVRVQAGKDPTVTLSAALDISRKIGEGSCYEALSGIGQVLVQAGQDKTNIFLMVIETANQIQYEYPRSKTLLAIAQAQVQAKHFSEALETADQTEDDEVRSKILLAIAQAQARSGELFVALATAHKIHDKGFCSKAFVGIAKAQVQTGQDPTNTLSAALDATMQIRDKWAHLVALSDIAIVQIQAGIFSGALETVRQIQEESDRSLSIAKARAKCEQHIASMYQNREHGFLPIFSSSKLLEVAYRSKALLATVQSQTGQFSEALYTANLIKDEYCRSEALSSIAQAQAQAGQFSMALDTTNLIKEERRRYKALTEIAETQAQAGQDATHTLLMVLEIASQIEDKEVRYRALSKIAQAQAQAGQAPTNALLEIMRIIDSNDDWLVRLAETISEIPAKMIKSIVLQKYLPLVANYLSSAYQACAMLAHIYPSYATDIAKLLGVDSVSKDNQK